MPPLQCAGVKANGLRCGVLTRNEPGEDGHVRCGTHGRIYENGLRRIQDENALYGPPIPGACSHVMPGRRCGIHATPNGLCQGHANVAERAAARLRLRAANQLAEVARREQQRRDEENHANQLAEQAFNENPRLLWSGYANRWYHQLVVNNAFRFVVFERACIILCQLMHPGENPHVTFRGYYFRLMNPGLPGLRGGHHEDQPPPLRDLERIARDAQSVHTRVVTVQTNKGLDKLLAYPVPKEQVTCLEIARMWLDRPANKINMDLFEQVLTDMTRWYKTPSCKENNDYLYKRALDGLWAIISQITDKSVHTEVCKRLREELRESYKMCCEGHISRMVNVMVGFDDSFKQNIPVGELLQHRMSAIAALGLETADAVARATQVLIELAVPQDQHSAWLDAF